MSDWYGDGLENIKRVKKLPIEYVIPGMVVARDVLTSTTQVIIPRDMVITDKAIQKIKTFNVEFIYVYADEAFQKISTGYSEKIRNSKAFKEFAEKYNKSMIFVKNTLINVTKTNEDIDIDRIIEDIENVMNSTNNNIGVFQMINCLKKFDDDTFIHSMNVSLLCNVFAYWLGISERDKKTLILGGIFHDIGKLLIPKALLRKSGKLTDVEFDMIKLHTVRGFEFIKDKKLPVKVKKIILNHHERYNGSGYPNRKSGKDVDDFSTIVAIADVYEAMTSKRVYHDSICPFEVIRYFEQEGFHNFNPKFMVPLLDKITETYIGHTVRLSNGQEAEIIQINKHALSQPVIRLKNDEFLDMSMDRNLDIVDVL